MIIYSPTDGDALTSKIPSMPQNCFLITRLANPLPQVPAGTMANIYFELGVAQALGKETVMIKLWRTGRGTA
ncbi:MAG: hypothetical protein Q7V56_11755 [Gammaproteobacteria bacterium]|nr:hypothetical protein [Gammaproteobacteria bacterium]